MLSVVIERVKERHSKRFPVQAGQLVNEGPHVRDEKFLGRTLLHIFKFELRELTEAVLRQLKHTLLNNLLS